MHVPALFKFAFRADQNIDRTFFDPARRLIGAGGQLQRVGLLVGDDDV